MPDGPPGAIVIVQRGAQRRVYTAGVPELGSRQPIRVADRMRLASTAKAFSGAVALSLVDAHKLSLSDTIAKLLPQLPAAWGKVTLGQALHHTSGLPELLRNEALIDYATKHPHGKPTPMFLLHFLAHDPLDFRPGSQYHYSNTDNFVVALMAQAVTHTNYASLLKSRVYRPLGLTHTTLPRGSAMPNPYLHGYQPDPPGPLEDVSTLLSAAYAWASGGLVSTPGDLNRSSAATPERACSAGPSSGSSCSSSPGTRSRSARGPTAPGWRSSATGHGAGPCTGIPATPRATRSSWRRRSNGQRSVTASVSGQITNKMSGPGWPPSSGCARSRPTRSAPRCPEIEERTRDGGHIERLAVGRRHGRDPPVPSLSARRRAGQTPVRDRDPAVPSGYGSLSESDPTRIRPTGVQTGF